jgi:hypothetical protein
MVGVRYRRTLFPGFSDKAEYSFNCPATPAAHRPDSVSTESFRFDAPSSENQKLYVEAKLQYRKIDQFLINFLYGEDSGLTTPVTTISEVSGVIEVLQSQATPAGGSR